jgi:arylformamidase
MTLNFMRIYDISVPLSSLTPTYPGDPGIEVSQWLSLTKGDSANVSLLHMGAHSGTHVDAPAHFIRDALQVGSLALNILIGEALVVRVPDSVLVIEEDFVVANCSAATKRVLFKTRNSSFWRDQEQGFRADYTYLHPEAARQLVKLGVELVGIDYLSVEQFKSEGFETHHILLSNGIVIVEGLDLSEVPAGVYELICLPLKLAAGSGDGAPARAVLRPVPATP